MQRHRPPCHVLCVTFRRAVVSHGRGCHLSVRAAPAGLLRTTRHSVQSSPIIRWERRSQRHRRRSPHGSLFGERRCSADHTFDDDLLESATLSACIVRQISRRCQPLALTFTLVSVPLRAPVATAQSPSAPALVTSHLAQGIVDSRLIPLARAKAPSITSWVTKRRFMEYCGTPAVMQVMTGGARGHEYTDSLLFYRTTLRPICDNLHSGGMTTVLSFDGPHVKGRVTRRDSAARQINLTTGVPSFSDTIDEIVVQLVPLQSNSHTSYQLGMRDRLRSLLRARTLSLSSVLATSIVQAQVPTCRRPWVGQPAPTSAEAHAQRHTLRASRQPSDAYRVVGVRSESDATELPADGLLGPEPEIWFCCPKRGPGQQKRALKPTCALP